MASATGTMRGTMQGSWRPPMEITVGVPAVSTVCWGFCTLGVGLTASRTTTSSPLEMPPRMPPAWLEAKPSWVMGSLASLPRMRVMVKPSPISTPLTAPMPISAPASWASSLP